MIAEHELQRVKACKHAHWIESYPGRYRYWHGDWVLDPTVSPKQPGMWCLDCDRPLGVAQEKRPVYVSKPLKAEPKPEPEPEPVKPVKLKPEKPPRSSKPEKPPRPTEQWAILHPYWTYIPPEMLSGSIRAYLDKTGMSQARLAHLCRITPHIITRLLYHQVWSQLVVAHKIADITGAVLPEVEGLPGIAGEFRLLRIKKRLEICEAAVLSDIPAYYISALERGIRPVTAKMEIKMREWMDSNEK